MAFFLYFYHLSAVGMLGPDEPRYASIAREMARSGDWITPRLWGEPWFEKSPLLYWMTGPAFRLGLSPDLAARLPISLAAIAFLVFYWWILNREFGCRAAWFSTLILGTCVAWLGFSQVSVTDLPLTATYASAMLLALPWIANGDQRRLPLVAALLGVAVLAKYLVAMVLALPLALRYRSLRDLLRPRVVLPFLVIPLPWYLLCYLRNGRQFLEVAWLHQVGRVTSDALMHGQPWWFYAPRFVALLLPWAPLLLLLISSRAAYRDPRRRFLAVWLVFGLVFFSLATNKLPGYVLPLLPAAAALMGIALDEAADARWLLAACALLLVAFPVAAPIFPSAVANGLSRAPAIVFRWSWILPVGAAAFVWMLDAQGRRLAAVLSVAVGAAIGVVYLKTATVAELNRVASARNLWQEIQGRTEQVCVDSIHRDWRYGLNFYSVTPLPDCSAEPRPLRVVQAWGEPPRLTGSRAAL
jgi:4-amino-4-deoxy-L-arabinose transferase-like glycosyltransferase